MADSLEFSMEVSALLEKANISVQCMPSYDFKALKLYCDNGKEVATVRISYEYIESIIDVEVEAGYWADRIMNNLRPVEAKADERGDNCANSS